MRSSSGKLTAEYVIVQFSIQTLYPFKMQCLLHFCCILLLWGSLEYGNPFPLHCGRKLCWSQTLNLLYKADSSVLNSPFVHFPWYSPLFLRQSPLGLSVHLIVELHVSARASGAPHLTKFGHPSFQEISVITWLYARPTVCLRHRHINVK